MSDVQARVVEVLAEHRMKYGNVCTCKWSAEAQKVAGKSGTLGDLHRAHVAAVLAEAGLLADHAYCNERVDRADQRTDAARVVAAPVVLTTPDEAIAAWEQKGPTSLTVALMADALYAARAELANAERRGAVAALRDMADLIDGGPTFPLPPSVISALVRDRADRIEGGDRD